jgi:hypothetical protein
MALGISWAGGGGQGREGIGVWFACANCTTRLDHQYQILIGECLLHVSTFATTRVALPTEIEPGLITLQRIN